MANNFKNAGIIVSTPSTLLYTCPSNLKAAVIHALYLTNLNDVAEEKVILEIEDSSTTLKHKILYNVRIPVGSTLIIDKVINLESNDKVYITAAENNMIEAFASLVEVS